MAVTRPLKEGSVTTYQQKVALGFPDILASEMDADLDTIYAAWNGGVGTANLVDGSVTYAKLAPDAQLWRDTGTTLVPGTSFATRPVAVPGDATSATLLLGSTTAKGRVQSLGAFPGTIGMFSNRVWATNAQDDATKPSWGVQCDPTAGADNFLVQRSPAGSTAQANLLKLDATGQLTLASNFNPLSVGGRTIKARLVAHPAVNAFYLTSNNSLNGSSVFVQDDAAKASWNVQFDCDGDSISFTRRPPGGGVAAVLTLDATSNLILAGSVGQKASGTTWANPSDPRLKDDVAPYARGLADVLALEPITYRLKAQADGATCYGFDAAKVRDVFPECVSEMRMKLAPDDDEETDGVLCFDMHPILVALVNAVKELAARR